MKLLCCLVLAVSLWISVLGSKCHKPDSVNCIVLDWTSNEPALPNLSGKTSLQIKGGNLASFGEKLSNQLGSVKKLTLGPLGMQELFLNADLLELTANDNKIHVVKFKASAGKYLLEKLDLRANQLKHLAGFEVLISLTELHLENNQLELVDFGVFEQMVNLKELHLEHNQITRVEAMKVIDFPKMEYLSLAGNQLTKLNVAMWKSNSLTTWDVSSNDLIYVDGIDVVQQFQSLQTVMLSGNEWHCKWLKDSLAMFGNNAVNVGDKDDDRTDCGKNYGDICCDSMEVFNGNAADKLTTIENDQKAMNDNWIKELQDIESDHNRKLSDLSNLLRNLQHKLNTPPTLPSKPLNTKELSELTTRTEQLKTAIKNELDASQLRTTSNEKSVKALEHTISQLRKALRQQVGKIATLKQQFTLLLETTNQP